jgi:hypothetical protein
LGYMSPMGYTLERLAFLGVILLISSVSASQAQGQAAPSQTPTPRTAAKPDAKFVFTIKNIELEGPASDAHRYRVEGVTINGWRFLIDCSDFPPPSALKGASADEISRKIEQHRDFPAFRKIVLERVGWASLSARGDRMVLYANVASMEDAIKAHTPLQELFADCPIVNHIENGADMSPLEVVSSQFRNWKNGTGYEIQARILKESLTLGCTEEKGVVCMSLPPNTYRVTRSGSQMRLYDADLNLIGVYRIVSEGPPPRE